MQKTNFICSRVLEEFVILSDGRITTCCLDAKGQNTFADIYEDDLVSTVKKLRAFRKRFVENISDFPTCVRCLQTRRSYYNDLHKHNPSEHEVSDFMFTDAMPKRLVIELTTACNMACIGCISGRKEIKDYRKIDKGQFINVDRLKLWLGPSLSDLNLVRLYNYGETFLHPEAIDFCSFLTGSQPSLNVSIATNLMPLNEKNKILRFVKAQPNSLVISLHGASQESIEKYMGPNANMKKVLKLMKRVIKKRDKLGLDLPIVAWKYLLFKWNDSTEEMSKAKELFREYKIDVLGFEIANGPFASEKYSIGSKDFECLQKSEFYFRNAFKSLINLKRKRIS